MPANRAYLAGPLRGNICGAICVPIYGRPRNPPAGFAEAGFWKSGLMTFGAGCPTGPAMPPGRLLGLGRTCAPAHPAYLQPVLPVYRQFRGSRGHVAGSFSPGVPYARQLSFGAWRVCHMDDQRNAQSADRPLPANQTGSHHRFAGRCHARGRKQGLLGQASGSVGVARRTQPASAIGIDTTLTRTARGGSFARFAAARICRDSDCTFRSRRHREIPDQPGANRAGTHPATNGSAAFMKARTELSFMILVRETRLEKVQ